LRKPPLVEFEAEGVWVRNAGGSKYLDFGSDIAVNDVPRISPRCKSHKGATIITQYQVELAEKLFDITSWHI
jgi:4-aminobutyrate aminotransferase-like enzyme